MNSKEYRVELELLQVELAKLQHWVQSSGARIVVLFEGRDAAGKGGAIKRITERMNPRVCKVVALAAPNEQEPTQWYFQRYVTNLPSAGQIVLSRWIGHGQRSRERVTRFSVRQRSRLPRCQLHPKVRSTTGTGLASWNGSGSRQVWW
jgi:polyphosphate kinase 2 (PPK2 family)